MAGRLNAITELFKEQLTARIPSISHRKLMNGNARRT
jgi:hypothetical protein